MQRVCKPKNRVCIMREMRISYFYMCATATGEKNTQVNYADAKRENVKKSSTRMGFIRVDNFARGRSESDFCPLPIALDLAARLQQIV
jgi:hypothetical protein